jgi:hypothetical protein
MEFDQAAQQASTSGNISRGMQLTLQFLLANGVGQANACPLDQILAHLASHGIYMTGPQFQTTILAETRTGDIFIGSGSRGYFLIHDQADAQAAKDFYQSRIKSELQRIDHLTQLAQKRNWNI